MGIVAITALGLAGIWAAFPSGRAILVDWTAKAALAAKQGAGIAPDRAEVEASWRDRRDGREARTREGYRRIFDGLSPACRDFLRLGGLGPDEAVIRWGNYDMSLLMSSKVFERDDGGRYYRLRPNVRSVWFRQPDLFDVDTCQFLLPETPDVLGAAKRAGAVPVSGSGQTTNSWGCRGPEPDLAAPVRGLVLGDSFMQGMFIGDAETPPACLARHLESDLGTRVSILNTGHLGYSPEHYYNTLRAYLERLQPQFVVVAYYANDFGLERDVIQGKGDWGEANHWFEKVIRECTRSGAFSVFAPIPDQGQLFGNRNPGHYPCRAVNDLGLPGPYFCDPTEAFLDEDLRLERRLGRVVGRKSPLYNARLGDGHLSPLGADLWGRTVARRLALLLASRGTTGTKSHAAEPGPIVVVRGE
ncbi:MAG: SGNH/GDSL hydrolase family protein [Isosphaeraceae bacterium]|nr:SGNH/GDSL hydrolase family protein [Isosphaeraceae bacterium]